MTCLLIGHLFVELYAGLPFSETSFSEFFSTEGLHIKLPMLVILSTIIGGFCKEIIEEENTIVVKGMLGLINYTYHKNEIIWTYTDKHILNPAGSPGSISNEHILLKDKKHKSIIYPIGTHKFDELKERLTAIQREQKGQPNENHSQARDSHEVMVCVYPSSVYAV